QIGRSCQEYWPIDQVFNKRYLYIALRSRTYAPSRRKETTRMNAIVKETQATQDFEQLKSRLRTIWTTGDYDLFSRFMEKDAQDFFKRLGVQPGTRLLDVGCGSGQLALIAARAGAQVTGCDIATNWLEKARARAAAEGLKITFEEGDAESLPYAD